jgi:SAM-dependent methyltransferase
MSPLPLRKEAPIHLASTSRQLRCAWREPGTRASASSTRTQRPLPFDPESFEAVVNAFGLCHFPNPDLALREAFRVLKPGGRVAFSVWDRPERVIGLGALYDAIRDHGSTDVGLPAGPNFFLFSSPEQSTKALRHAGFDSPTFRTVPQVWRSSDPDNLFAMLATGTVRAAATLRTRENSSVRPCDEGLPNTKVTASTRYQCLRSWRQRSSPCADA